MNYTALPFETLLLRKIDKTETCWLWLGYLGRDGYGVTPDADGRNRNCHRVVYEFYVGPIPEGMHLDHLCRVRHCVNPEHLEPVTPAENARRSVPAARGHCQAGHEYTPENTATRKLPSGGTGRVCKTCRRGYVSAYQARAAS